MHTRLRGIVKKAIHPCRLRFIFRGSMGRSPSPRCIQNSNDRCSRKALRLRPFSDHPEDRTDRAPEFISDDVTHGIAVVELGIDMRIWRSRSNDVVTTPVASGDFAGTCTRYCGIHHDRMEFLTHVVSD